MKLPPVSIDTGRAQMSELQQRYQKGEINRNSYLIQKGKLQEKIDQGRAIKRTPFGLALKIFVVIALFGMAAAIVLIVRDWTGYLFAALEVGSAIWVLSRP
ncbi:MAG: hypothetical protein LBM94_02785 [Propionibacteriaceae bacterium]|jgi:hypothetical protein|nr:hypothetical protein [Propionibacteriaceae bacterium]